MDTPLLEKGKSQWKAILYQLTCLQLYEHLTGQKVESFW